MTRGPAAPRSDAILERLLSLHPKIIDLSLGRLERLLARLGNPETRLAPVVHVAGTNGKGSTVAYLRAMAEAAGLRVQVYSSPHLVRFHERIRLSGGLISEPELSRLLEVCEEANGGEPSPSSRSPRPPPSSPSRARRPTCCCWRSAWAGGWTPPT
ncbi:MAG: hypothetical protein P8X61_01665 [Limibacillus sp.]